MDKFEKLVNEIMAEAEADGEPVTREEAEDMAKMELGAKEIKNYTQAQVEKTPRKAREKKIDEEKKSIIELLQKCLIENGYISAVITNVDKNIDFEDFTINLIRHRKKKK